MTTGLTYKHARPPAGVDYKGGGLESEGLTWSVFAPRTPTPAGHVDLYMEKSRTVCAILLVGLFGEIHFQSASGALVPIDHLDGYWCRVEVGMPYD